MMFKRDHNPRYVARPIKESHPLLGIQAGVVEDTRPDEPTRFEHDGTGFTYVTTYSNAKRIARKANKLDRKEAGS